MSDTLSPVGRQVRFSVIASLAALLTLSLTLLAKPPRAAEAKPAAGNAVATAPEAAPDNTNESVGCGCAESCYATN
jgi:hypothetical protein